MLQIAFMLALAGYPAPAAPAALPGPALNRETPARLLRLAPPVFPPRAEKARWNSSKAHTVRLKVYVDAEGKAQKVNVLEGVHGPWGFDESATEAAMRSTYAPATRDNCPVGGSLQITVTFEAQDRKR